MSKLFNTFREDHTVATWDEGMIAILEVITVGDLINLINREVLTQPDYGSISLKLNVGSSACGLAHGSVSVRTDDYELVLSVLQVALATGEMPIDIVVTNFNSSPPFLQVENLQGWTPPNAINFEVDDPAFLRDDNYPLNRLQQL